MVRIRFPPAESQANFQSVSGGAPAREMGPPRAPKPDRRRRIFRIYKRGGRSFFFTGVSCQAAFIPMRPTRAASLGNSIASTVARGRRRLWQDIGGRNG
jgi:hypothetical protein